MHVTLQLTRSVRAVLIVKSFRDQDNVEALIKACEIGVIFPCGFDTAANVPLKRRA